MDRMATLVTWGMFAWLAGLCLFVAMLVANVPTLSLHKEVHKLATLVTISKFL